MWQRSLAQGCGCNTSTFITIKCLSWLGGRRKMWKGQGAFPLPVTTTWERPRTLEKMSVPLNVSGQTAPCTALTESFCPQVTHGRQKNDHAVRSLSAGCWTFQSFLRGACKLPGSVEVRPSPQSGFHFSGRTKANITKFPTLLSKENWH